VAMKLLPSENVSNDMRPNLLRHDDRRALGWNMTNDWCACFPSHPYFHGAWPATSRRLAAGNGFRDLRTSPRRGWIHRASSVRTQC
jgi:hypothetical protein